MNNEKHAPGTAEVPTPAEAREIPRRFCASHFHTAEQHARTSIPADLRDDDIRMCAFIDWAESLTKLPAPALPAVEAAAREITGSFVSDPGRTIGEFVAECEAIITRHLAPGLQGGVGQTIPVAGSLYRCKTSNGAIRELRFGVHRKNNMEKWDAPKPDEHLYSVSWSGWRDHKNFRFLRPEEVVEILEEIARTPPPQNEAGTAQ